MSTSPVVFNSVCPQCHTLIVGDYADGGDGVLVVSIDVGEYGECYRVHVDCVTPLHCVEV